MAGKGKPRRPKGTGSIYERDGVVIGQYEVQMPEGKIKRKYVRGKDGKRERWIRAPVTSPFISHVPVRVKPFGRTRDKKTSGA